MYALLFILLIPALFAADPAKAGLDPERLARIPASMKEFVDQNRIAGAVTLVQRRGVVGSLDAIGWQDLEGKKPMRTDAIFQIMSMTKPVTGVGIMMLLEEGKLALADPIEKHLPEFRSPWVIASKEGETALHLKRPSRLPTIRDLMTHTSGVPSGPPPAFRALYQKMDRTLAEAVLVTSQQPLEFEPGSQWRYSNMGIATLGRIIEVLAGVPFEQFLETRIFAPLGMKDSHIFLPSAKQVRLAALYRVADGKLRRAGADPLGGDAMEYRKGARYSGPEFAMYSTAQDLAAFYQMMLNNGTYGGKRLISRASVEAMTAVHTGELKSGHNPGTSFGLTWEVTKDPIGEQTLMSIGSFGHGGAFGTHGWVDRKKDLVGVFLIQTASDATDVKYAFMSLAGAAAE